MSQFRIIEAPQQHQQPLNTQTDETDLKIVNNQLRSIEDDYSRGSKVCRSIEPNPTESHVAQAGRVEGRIKRNLIFSQKKNDSTRSTKFRNPIPPKNGGGGLHDELDLSVTLNKFCKN